MMGGAPQAQQPEQIKAVRIQTSAYGTTRSLVFGTNRVSMNLIWYGDFKAEPIQQQSGGK